MTVSELRALLLFPYEDKLQDISRPKAQVRFWAGPDEEWEILSTYRMKDGSVAIDISKVGV